MHRLTLVALLAIQGCAGPTWVKPGAVQADFDRDVAQCKYEAASATASYGGGPTRRTTAGALGQGIGEGIDLGLRQRDLIMLCLQARGYTKQAAGM